MTNDKQVVLNTTIPASIKEKLDKQAKQNLRPVKYELAMILERYFTEQEKGKQA